MLSNVNYIAAAFGVVWAGLFIYIFMLMRKEQSLRRDLETLKEDLMGDR